MSNNEHKVFMIESKKKVGRKFAALNEPLKVSKKRTSLLNRRTVLLNVITKGG
jgi:hypothetical protein